MMALQELLSAFRKKKVDSNKSALDRYLAMETLLFNIEQGQPLKAPTVEEFEATTSAIGISFDNVAARLQLRGEIAVQAEKRDQNGKIADTQLAKGKKHADAKAAYEAYVKSQGDIVDGLYAEYTGAMRAAQTRDWHAEKVREAENAMARLLPVLDS